MNKQKLTIVICLSLLISLLSIGGARADINNISNPGFETGDLTGWTTGGDYGSIGIYTYLPHSGSYECDLAQATSPCSISQSGFNIAYEDISAFGFWYKSTNDFSVNVTTLTGSSTTYPEGSGSWVYFDLLYMLEEGDTLAGVKFESAENYADIRLDDIEIITGGSPTPTPTPSLSPAPSPTPAPEPFDLIRVSGFSWSGQLLSNTFDIELSGFDNGNSLVVAFGLFNEWGDPDILNSIASIGSQGFTWQRVGLSQSKWHQGGEYYIEMNSEIWLGTETQLSHDGIIHVIMNNGDLSNMIIAEGYEFKGILALDKVSNVTNSPFTGVTATLTHATELCFASIVGLDNTFNSASNGFSGNNYAITPLSITYSLFIPTKTSSSTAGVSTTGDFNGETVYCSSALATFYLYTAPTATPPAPTQTIHPTIKPLDTSYLNWFFIIIIIVGLLTLVLVIGRAKIKNDMGGK